MSDAPDDHDRILRSLSALADGEASADEQERACRAWNADPQARGRWHAYQLIGDVLRSEELAFPAARDRVVQQGLRRRLASEPVVLAPQVTPRDDRARHVEQAGVAAFVGTSTRRVRRGAPLAASVAAGFVAVAGAYVALRPNSTTPESRLAAAPVSVPVQAQASGTLVRSAELDRYLAAHRQFNPGVAVAVPGGLRSVATTPDGR